MIEPRLVDAVTRTNRHKRARGREPGDAPPDLAIGHRDGQRAGSARSINTRFIADRSMTIDPHPGKPHIAYRTGQLMIAGGSLTEWGPRFGPPQVV